MTGPLDASATGAKTSKRANNRVAKRGTDEKRAIVNMNMVQRGRGRKERLDVELPTEADGGMPRQSTRGEMTRSSRVDYFDISLILTLGR